MAKHRYQIGEKVRLLTGAAVHFATIEVYEIVQQLPESDGEYQYKIKSLDEPHLRVAKESQLRRIWDGTMKRIAAALMLAAATAAAEPNVVADQCAKQAEQVFARDYANGSVQGGKNWTKVFKYRAHYNADQNKCFFMELSTVLDGKDIMSGFRLFDVLDYREYGNFMRSSNFGVLNCLVEGTACRTEAGWNKLVKPYMEE
jgi:hypothetical protein